MSSPALAALFASGATAQSPPSVSNRSSSRSVAAMPAEPTIPVGTLADGQSTREARQSAIRAIPFDQLTPDAVQRLRGVIEDASYFRRMPTQTIACEPEMYTFLIRHPEVVVGLWDVMGITRVSLERTGEYQLHGDDGAGTKCKMDLVFGSDNLHIYQSQGAYEGNLWARELKGRCIVCIHNRPAKLKDGRSGMIAWMDAFMKLDNVGADLAVRTLGPLVAKTADHNFIECAGFFSQISQTAKTNPSGLTQIATQLPRVAPPVRDQFIETSLMVAGKSRRSPLSNVGWNDDATPPKLQEMEPGDSPTLQILSATDSLPVR